ncbi:hypothetical protein CC80DRAFT_493852 [Byssothecium circinans]|uniref:Uncharacterized protein n=1 Tax=Byssothecium circinans TaxID=147558 RepID=A0A6A5TRN1_9PLEO|nr:hypothetical protein CC80DRAFT_493852 [Byssothecium circinans]
MPTENHHLNQPSWAQPRLNVHRCVELHNEILRIGWQGLGHDSQDFNPPNWFQTHGEKAEAVREHLSTDLIKFLEQAGGPLDWSFHWYVYGLADPESMFFWEEILHWKSERKHRFLTLYLANDITSHQVGVVFDQQTNTAIMCTDVEDTSVVTNGRLKWWPLETVLEAWLDMIKKGKVKATKQGETDLERFEPWVLVPYTETGLEETIQTFNKLVQAIESHISRLVNNQAEYKRLIEA